MSRVLTNEKNYYDIADTIRQMKNVNTTYKPREMASALKDIYSNEVEGTLPLNFESNGMPLIDYRIDGASGGVGDRTKNLFNYNTVTEGYRVQWATGNLYRDESAIMSDYILVEENSIYNCNIDVYFLGYDTNFNYLGAWNGTTFVKNAGLATKQLTITEGCSYINFFTYNTNKTPVSISNLTMLNEGSTELPYEPYGYKVPVVCGETTTNIYINEPIGANESISLSDTEVDIPTIEGTNVLTIDTTVQPSSVYVQAPKDSLEVSQIANRLEEI